MPRGGAPPVGKRGGRRRRRELRIERQAARSRPAPIRRPRAPPRRSSDASSASRQSSGSRSPERRFQRPRLRLGIGEQRRCAAEPGVDLARGLARVRARSSRANGKRSGAGSRMIAGSLNRLNRNGSTAASESGPPRFISTIAVRAMSATRRPARQAAARAPRHARSAFPAIRHGRD